MWILAVASTISLWRLALAQCDGPSLSITSNSDVASISSCTTYNGDITVDSSTSENITLSGIGTINGNLVATNATSIQSLQFPDLATVSGTLRLEGLPSLTELAWPLLSSVGTLYIKSIPLESISFPAGLDNVDTINVYSTSLHSFYDIYSSVVESIEMRDNENLGTIAIGQVENATTLSFHNNSPSLELGFDNLQFVFGNLTLSNISGLATGDLQNITGAFTCYSCAITTYQSTWLQMIGGGLAFVSTQLSSIKLPDLSIINGGLQISNNSDLTTLDGFDGLGELHGGLKLNGNFDSIKFRDIGYIDGDVIVETSSTDTSICDYFDSLLQEQTIRDSLSCHTGSASSLTTDTTPLNASSSSTSSSSTSSSNSNSSQNSNSSNSSSSLSGGAIAGIVIGAVIFGALLTYLALFLLRRRRRRHERHRQLSPDLDPSHPSKPPTFPIHLAEMSNTTHPEKAELSGSTRAATEMSAAQPYSYTYREKTVPGVHEAGDYRNETKVASATTSDAVNSLSAQQTPLHSVRWDGSSDSSTWADQQHSSR